MWRQHWPPDVEVQDDPYVGTAVSRFVFDAVVEDQQLAFLPCAGLVSDAQGAARRNDQRQVANQAAVQHPGMARDVRAGFEAREKDRRSAAAYARERHLFE